LEIGEEKDKKIIAVSHRFQIMHLISKIKINKAK